MKIAIAIPIMAIFSAIALFIGAVTSVNAGHHSYSMFGSDISQMDTNKDGMVSFEEYSDFHTEQMKWSFNALDVDNDGSISTDEWNTFLKMHGVGKSYHHKKQG